MIVYKAAARGAVEFPGLSSWTSSRRHAEVYTTAAFAGFGGASIYHTVAEDAVLDLRAGAADGLGEAGIDLADYEDEPLHDVLRAIAPVLRGWGYRWVAFCEHLEDETFDEWLHLGDRPIPALPED